MGGSASAEAYARTLVARTREALEPLEDPERAVPMQKYMKDVAPFLGMSTPVRRAALRPMFKGLGVPTQAELTAGVRALWAVDEREYQYAACDLLALHQEVPEAGFLGNPIEFLITTKSWWDTVDALGSPLITPLVARNPQLVDTMWTWLRGDNIWLTRAAIQHQRGRKTDTDVPLLVAMCHARSADREFFVAKAVGWALRDLAHIDADAAETFLQEHPDLAPVARREAVRGLTAVGRL